MEMFSRTEMLIGDKGLDILKNSHVAVFGVGGVGGYVVEALARSGIGTLIIIDFDLIDESPYGFLKHLVNEDYFEHNAKFVANS